MMFKMSTKINANLAKYPNSSVCRKWTFIIANIENMGINLQTDNRPSGGWVAYECSYHS